MSKGGFLEKVNLSLVLTCAGICILFASAILITLVAPAYVDPSWVEPTSLYQVEMYEEMDPNVYITSTKGPGVSRDLEALYHLRNKKSFLAFKESETLRIFGAPELEKYVTRRDDPILKLTSRLLLLRELEGSREREKQLALREEWIKDHPGFEKEGLAVPRFVLYEIYDPGKESAFFRRSPHDILENWVDRDFQIVDEDAPKKQGTIYILNPSPYRVATFTYSEGTGFRYDPSGREIESLEELKGPPFYFVSRKQLIYEGERTYAIEGCWYCHTDQTRTLIQDLVLNGSDSYPAPPSSPNEYIYQQVTFPGTKRNAPDLSRVGVKRPHRDWHISHFWAPRVESKGSIMPAFKHFFDFDPSGTAAPPPGVQNRKFEGIFQYLMTKGTRITPPTEAWWLGRDPLQVLEIIEGRKVIR